MAHGDGWIGVDLDGTLAHYDGWKGIEHIGAPVLAMLERVRGWVAEGRDVRIFTARVCCEGDERARAVAVIESWCARNVGIVLPVTNVKDFGMVELWDDRAVQVEVNTGQRYGMGIVNLEAYRDRTCPDGVFGIVVTATLSNSRYVKCLIPWTILDIVANQQPARLSALFAALVSNGLASLMDVIRQEPV